MGNLPNQQNLQLCLFIALHNITEPERERIMDYLTLLVGFSVVWICVRLLSFNGRSGKFSRSKIPPGPVPLPLIGNLFNLGTQLHESVTSLSYTYGPLMTLHLGRVKTVIVSSADMAKEILHTHDLSFASRYVPDVARALGHHEFSVGWLPPTTRWRNLRKICSSQMFSTRRLDANQSLRLQKIQELVAHVRNCAHTGQAIDVGIAAFTTTFSLLSYTSFSIDVVDPTSGSAQQFRDNVSGMIEELGKQNLTDSFPVLRFLDLQGIRKRMGIHSGKLMDFFDGMIEQRLQSGTSHGDFLDALLDYSKENSNEFSLNDIKHLLLDLFAAGTETTSTTLEWAMAELIHNPEVMKKARVELESNIGRGKQVEESDISRLPYLQAVIKENFRMHPAAPFMVPHKAEADVEIGGFVVPKGFQVLVNVCAISRDPCTWKNPNSFTPERFLESEIDVRGRNCELIPFGAGRRICPGLPLALRMLHLMVASLIRSFGWKLEDGTNPEDMDMSDKFGFTLRKAKPLRAIPVQID